VRVAVLVLVVVAGMMMASLPAWAAVISNSSAISIPGGPGAATPYPATIDVSGLSGTTTDVNVTLHGVSHTFPDEVAVLLVGPSGQNVMLMSDAGGGQDLNGVDLTFDDEATRSVPEGAGTQITTRSYRPTQGTKSAVLVSSLPDPPAPAGPYGTSLSVFDGADPNGTYSLYVYDDSSGDAGQIAGGFSLDVKTTADAPTDPPPTLGKAANWQMNEASGSGQMLDSSPNGNNGTPTDVDQGVQEDIEPLPGGDGINESTTYVFNGSTSHVLVPDADSLDPQANDITLTARVMVNGQSLDDDSYDVVRKGLVTTAGGDYKMEIKRKSKLDPSVGKLHCFFRGSGGTVRKVARPDIVDGNWHTLECIKTSGSVVARVDGGRSFTQAGSAGSIANASNVMVGGKQVDPRPDDMFDGSMDFVSIDIAQ
jgi:hypothetical protein